MCTSPRPRVPAYASPRAMATSSTPSFDSCCHQVVAKVDATRREISSLTCSTARRERAHPPDGVQDPHNLGACLRAADAAGAHAAVALSDRAVGLNATAEPSPWRRHHRAPRHVTNLRAARGDAGVGQAMPARPRRLHGSTRRSPSLKCSAPVATACAALTRETCDELRAASRCTAKRREPQRVRLSPAVSACSRPGASAAPEAVVVLACPWPSHHSTCTATDTPSHTRLDQAGGSA